MIRQTALNSAHGLGPVLRLFQLWINGLRLRYYRKAQREIHPLNDDVPVVTFRTRHLEDERRALVRG